MLDTVGIRCEARLRLEEHVALGSRVLAFGKGWKAVIRGGRLYRVEGSLARYNQGQLPQTEAETKTALERVFADLRSLADIDEWWFDRLDLARDVAEPTQPLVRACRYWRFTCIRKPASVEDDDSCIRWGNRRTEIEVRIYDAAKKHRWPAPLTRLEVSLKPKQVARRRLHHGVPWATLAETFDEFVALLPDTCPEQPARKLSDGQIVASLGLQHGPEVVLTLLELFQRSRSRATFRKIRKEVAAGIPEHLGKSPKQAFTLPRVFIGQKLSTTPHPEARQA